MRRMSHRYLFVFLIVAAAGCSGQQLTNAGKGVATAAADSLSNAPSAGKLAVDMKKAYDDGERREHEENVEELSEAYQEFLRKQDGDEDDAEPASPILVNPGQSPAPR